MKTSPTSQSAIPFPRALQDSGILTFLFTDVEGSTPLWERHEEAMRTAIARHDALLDAFIVAYGGRRVKERGEGDSVFAVFTEPAAAVAAALAIAQAVLAEPWPDETPLRVRLGLHSGVAQWRAGDYYGPVVNRCARIRGLGHGGQALLSSATAALVRNALPREATLRSLGAHSLKGISAPEEIFQLCHPTLPAAFPPLLSPQAPRHNLPEALSELIGREQEQGAVLALLATGRLVTLTGAGGVGKTRLALAVAAELVDQYPAGVWLVELAALAEPELLPGAVAQALGVREEPGRPLTQTLIESLRDKRLLLALDNCEHLITACATLVGALLRACPHLHILATSREGLDIAGERCYRVPSLPVPDLARLPTPERLAQVAAVALFVARARERRPAFTLTGQNARAVAQVCARLDGIPLALELAAARVGSLTVESIAARLDDRFRLLTGGARDTLPRQRTLRAALDWSYDLLSAAERTLLARLSVFAGGWTLAAAEAVCAGDGIEEGAVLDLLDGLVHKSLVQAEEGGAEERYGLLETMRQYGAERLMAAGATEALRERHLGWCLALGDEAEPALNGPEQGAWLTRLDEEHDNLRAALRWVTGSAQEPGGLSVTGGARERGAGQEGLRLAGTLWRFWYTRGYLSEGQGWLEAALAAGAGNAPAARAQVLCGAGVLALMQGDYGRAVASLEESLALYRALDDTRGTASALNVLGNVANDQGAFERAATLYEESLALHRARGDTRGIALALENLGWIAYIQGTYEQAAALMAESLVLYRALGDTYFTANALNNLGDVASAQGEDGRTAALLTESLQLSRDLGAGRLLADVLESVAWAAVARGQPRQAVHLGGAADAQREALGVPLRRDQQARHDQAVEAGRGALGAAAFAAAWAEGRALPLEEAVALALEDHVAEES